MNQRDASSAVARPQKAAEQQSRPTVFIVDDELGILDVVSRGLEGAGYQTRTFSGGREFERAVAREAPDLCIMDLSLPDLDGVAILGELAAQDYQGRILLISGHSEQLLRSVSRLAEDYRLKIIGCVRKPFTIKPLLEALDAYPAKAFVPTREDVVQAIRSEDIVVRYQPIVALPGNEIVATEALVRWQHPTEGMLAPGRFLHKLDNAGMSELTSLVLRNVFQNRVLWEKAGVHIKVSVNVPIPVILDPQFNSELYKLCERFQIGLDGLIVEIPETEMTEDQKGLAAALSGLCLRGVGVAVDDFGTGFSSLSRLQRLPIDEVKIDKSFIRHCATHPEDRKIVGAIIALAHALGMQVVAEGVETEAIAKLLAELGCDYAQGFLYGRAVTASELTGLINH
jgi:EAL domain-containing protein (putative c-di-GMP-specific phosphodiesterase class I)/CheY-like chemotaxis protein